MRELQNSSSGVPTECPPRSTWPAPAGLSHRCARYQAWTGSSWPCAQRSLSQSYHSCSCPRRQRRTEGCQSLGHAGTEREREREREVGERKKRERGGGGRMREHH